MDDKHTSNNERAEFVGTPIESSAKSTGRASVRYKFTERTLKRAAVGVGVIDSGDTHSQASSASLRRYAATLPGDVPVNAMAR
jgi:hypothetical protein